jgi:MFS family permease
VDATSGERDGQDSQRRPGLYYGWWITGASFLCVAARRGSETAYSVLLVVLVAEFGWERATITGAFSLSMLIAGCLAPLSGMLLDRFGPRLPFCIGTSSLALTAMLLAAMHRISHLYLIMGLLFAPALAMLNLGTLSAYLSRWFVRRRAMAIGVSQAGQGFGIFVLTPLVGWLIALAGWRTGYVIFGVGLLVLLLPLSLFVFRDSPHALGLQVDGVAPPTPAVASSARQHTTADFATGGWTLAQARRTVIFWTLLACFYFFPGANQVFFIHLVAYLTDHGLDRLSATFILSLAGLVSVPGRLLFGVLTDRLGGIPATQVSFGLSVLAVVIILLPNTTSLPVLYGFALVFGLSLGSRGVALGAFAANTFPGREFGAIYGWITSGQLIGGAIGPWLAGLAFDQLGSYRLVFYGCIAGFTLSALLIGGAALWTSPHGKPINAR